MKSFVLTFFAIISSPVLYGCTTINLNEQLSGDSKTTIHLGLILLNHDRRSLSANMQKINIVGGWVGSSSSGFGFKQNTYIKPAPDCQIVFIVKTDEQLNQSIKLAESTKHENGDKICITKL